MRIKADKDCVELKEVLQQMLVEDVTISMRAVVARHSQFENQSSISKDQDRRSLVDEYRRLQEVARTLARMKGADVKPSKKTATVKLKEAHERISTLECQIKALVSSHAACVTAVHLAGGTAGLLKFWAEYSSIERTLLALNAIPEGASVLDLGHRDSRP